ncbi:GNAT family N-acetyltransferase [Nocardioides bruguierae]|uniref:GNAT family N-acetyltransferase n=1 Tax=Nocardioides bruguierae TaxID=2945102 RepID=UPI00201FF546|nr:GNAT family N-acetyltransferase [Nocardioides bruguierae]MCL8027269.1 GNAT family N-acetyltransferase [Nocardioides bruguierae]
MSRLTIRPVRVEDDADYSAWHRVYRDAERADRGETFVVWTEPETREALRGTGSTRVMTAWAGTVPGPDGAEQTVAWGMVELPLRDNLTVGHVMLGVLPEHRRRGHGTALLAHLEAYCAEHGRTVLGTETSWPFELGQDPAGLPGLEFGRARGYALELVEVQRRLALPVAPAVLDDLAASAAPHHADYVLRAWVGDVPDDLVGGWAVLEASLETEAPTGGLTREPEQADVQRVREGDELFVRQGRTPYRAAALAPDGTVVAYTEVVTTVHEPTRAYQWGTLVDRDHRGHRLGVALKVAATRLLGEHQPEVREVITWNALDNPWMVSVNEALGFRPVECLGGLEKRTS